MATLIGISARLAGCKMSSALMTCFQADLLASISWIPSCIPPRACFARGKVGGCKRLRSCRACCPTLPRVSSDRVLCRSLTNSKSGAVFGDVYLAICTAGTLRGIGQCIVVHSHCGHVIRRIEKRQFQQVGEPGMATACWGVTFNWSKFGTWMVSVLCVRTYAFMDEGLIGLMSKKAGFCISCSFASMVFGPRGFYVRGTLLRH